MDFTSGRFVANAHNLFLSVNNANVENFFKQVFQGRPGVENSLSFEFDNNLNAYVLNRNISDEKD